MIRLILLPIVPCIPTKHLQRYHQICFGLLECQKTLKQCRELVEEVDIDQMQDLGDGYRIMEIGSWYGNVRQRWVVVFSEKAKEREKKTVERRLKKFREDAIKQLNQLHACKFACEKDAYNAAHTLSKKLKLMKISDIKILKKCIKEKKRAA